MTISDSACCFSGPYTINITAQYFGLCNIIERMQAILKVRAIYCVDFKNILFKWDNIVPHVGNIAQYPLSWSQPRVIVMGDKKAEK